MPKAATRKPVSAALAQAAPNPSVPAPKPASVEPAADKTPKAPLPPSLVQALPASKAIVKHLVALASEFGQLERELSAALKMGAIPAARAFVVLHRLKEKVDHDLKPLDAIFEVYKTAMLPELFEQDGVTSVPLAEGFRVGVGYATRASIRKDMKDKAYQWLRENGLGDLITPTVNSSTLSSTAKTLLEDDNRELPEDLFNVARIPTTSVTRT